MTELLPVAEVTSERISDTIRRALRDRLDATVIYDFVASIDWSGVDEDDLPASAEVVGQLLIWSTQYSEGDFSQEEYVDRLLLLAPANGAATETVVTDEVPSDEVSLSSSRTRPDMISNVPRSTTTHRTERVEFASS
jgi:hypothetical protein